MLDEEDVNKIQSKLAENYSIMQAQIDEQTRNIFDRTRDYNNTVVTIGYAGFFAIWAFTRDVLPTSVTIHVALAMGVSILLFVIFVVIDMLFLTYVTLKFHSNIRYNFNFSTIEEAFTQSEEHKSRAIEFQKEVRRATIGIVSVWPFFFLPSLACGLYAALVLMYNFIASLTEAVAYWPA